MGRCPPQAGSWAPQGGRACSRRLGLARQLQAVLQCTAAHQRRIGLQSPHWACYAVRLGSCQAFKLPAGRHPMHAPRTPTHQAPNPSHAALLAGCGAVALVLFVVLCFLGWACIRARHHAQQEASPQAPGLVRSSEAGSVQLKAFKPSTGEGGRAAPAQPNFSSNAGHAWAGGAHCSVFSLARPACLLRRWKHGPVAGSSGAAGREPPCGGVCTLWLATKLWLPRRAR